MSGIFSSMNKVRPGAYINFESQSNTKVNLGSRGIATMIFPLSWGPENDLIEITGSDMINGTSLQKIGLVASDAEAKLLNLALENCTSIKIFNPNNNGTAASAEISLDDEDTTKKLVVTAKYKGTFGNKIAILIRALDGKFSVETYANGYFVDNQKVSTISELVANDFVTFSGEGTLKPVTSTLLIGGVDGTVTESSTYLPTYFNKLKSVRWNTMAVTSTSANDKSSVANFIKQMREEEGKYVQAVINDYSEANYEGIINSINGVVLKDGTSIAANNFTVWVAGAIAGADIIESLTGKVVENAESIIGLLDNEEIIEALKVGKFVLSLTQNGDVKVEKDINSLHTFTIDKGYTFSKNRIIRELDEIGSSIEYIWETSYLGKVSNNENGRTLFKSSIISYLSELANKGAIQDFDSSTVEVEKGDDIDSVVANIAVKPVDSMEFLYMTINVAQ